MTGKNFNNDYKLMCVVKVHIKSIKFYEHAE